MGTDAYSHISDEMSVIKSHYNYFMMDNFLLNKLWNIITGCIVT